MANGTNKQREEFERSARERQEKIAKAFRHFGAAIARERQIDMAECPACGGEHPMDVGKEIRKAVERVRRARAGRKG